MHQFSATLAGGADALVLNRHQRRSLDSNKAQHTNPVLKDRALTEEAFRLLVANMERYGNTLTEDHRTALLTILHRLTMLANSSETGRFAYDLPCGGGKTQAIVAWCAAVLRQRKPYTATVCASKVEALCDLKRDLIANGVPADEVGLVHSYGFDPAEAEAAQREGRSLRSGFASLPATGDNSKRKIVLVTHARVRGKGGAERYNLYRGIRRHLVIWDESLIVSDHRAIERVSIRQGLGYLGPLVSEGRASAELVAALDYLGAAWGQLEAEREAQQDDGRKPRPVYLPPVFPEELDRYLSAIPQRDATDSLRQLLEISQAPLRVFTGSQGGGFVSYDVVVPPELRSVAVLDASWAIRDLERLDSSIHDDPLFRGDVKRYSAVTFHHLRSGAGRETMTRDFAQRREGRKVSKEVAEVAKGIPADQGVLIFTFKARGKMDMAETLRGDLEAAGIDTSAVLPSGKPRFAFLTWGQETSTNDHKHCSNVILAGVLQRSAVDLAGAIAGQLDNLTADLDHGDIHAVRRSEVAHCVYQAINRAAMRDTVNGEAKATNVWLIHLDAELRPILEKVMPGATWREWKPVAIEVNKGKIAEVANMIGEHLRSLPPEVSKVSTRSLKVALDAAAVPNRSWTAAVNAVSDEGWALSGRSFVRTGGLAKTA